MTTQRQIDHTDIETQHIEDTNADPEGAATRTAAVVRPQIRNPFVQDRVYWNEHTNRYEPQDWYIQDLAATLKEAFRLHHKRGAKKPAPALRKAVNALLKSTDFSNGQMTGFLFSFQNLLMTEAANTLAWYESSGEYIAWLEDNSDNDETLENVRARSEQNESSLITFFDMLQILEEEQELAVNADGWSFAARNGIWRFVGFFTRQAAQPERESTRRQQRKTTLERLQESRQIPQPDEEAEQDEEAAF